MLFKSDDSLTFIQKIAKKADPFVNEIEEQMQV